jgi:phage shock protein PspC (stress-responsive transcriptional regulator)
MKKIININLAGRVIPIEDSAYESLQRYIESLRRYFAGEEGRDEIINDIESRVAELMNDKIKKGSVAITDADIQEIVTSMGRVEDFQEADTADTASATGSDGSAGSSATSPRYKGRLYRDSQDKFLGGVCAGIANYMNWDPVIVRLLFAIITFGGFGMGILLYIVLWIVLPKKSLEHHVSKRFYRNPDDRVIGGVAGGLAAYFNKDAWMIRLIFAAPLILNILFGILNGLFFFWHRDLFPNFFFGSFTGTFIITYVILWIILPEARTTYEKMEMRGEKVDVNRIKQNVQEGMTGVKNRMQAWGEEVKESAQNLGNRAGEFAAQGKTFANEAVSASRPAAQGLGYAIAVIIKAFFIFIAGSIAFGLFVAFIVLVFGGGTALWPLKQSVLDFGLDGSGQKALFWLTIILFFLVPVIAFITWIIRRLMKVRSQKSYLGWIFGGLWTIGLFCLIALISSIARDVRYYERLEQPIAVAQPAGGKMLVKVSEPRIQYSGDLWWADNDTKGWDIVGDTLKLSNIKLKVSKSEDSSYSVTVWKYSAGRTRNQAAEKASKIVYTASALDSIITLGSGYAIDENSKFRGQKVIVEVKVPVGKMIRFDESVTEKLYPVNVRIRHNRTFRRDGWNDEWDRDWDEDRYFFDWRTDVDYVMDAEGKLQEFGKPVKSSTTTEPDSDTYEYERRETERNNNDSIQRLIDEQRKKAEAEQKKLEELQRKIGARKNAEQSTLVKKKMIKTDNEGHLIASPIFSLFI